MSFLGKLGRGFISSAVNQVGRDTGKVFSNSIYGDRHATPIRHVGGKTYHTNQMSTINPEAFYEINREEAIANGYRINDTCKMTGGRIALFIFYVITSIIMPIGIFSLLMCIVFLRWAYQKKTRNFTYLEKDVRVPIKVSDRRYKYGYRIEGYRLETERILTPATFEELEKYKKQGNKEMIISIIPFVISIIFTIYIFLQ